MKLLSIIQDVVGDDLLVVDGAQLALGGLRLVFGVVPQGAILDAAELELLLAFLTVSFR
jgi:hypothetical protein